MADGAAMPAGGALMPRATVHQLVASKERALAAYLAVWDGLAEANGLAADAAPSGRHGDLPYLGFGSPYGRSHKTFQKRAEYEAAITKGLDQQVWSHVVQATQLDQLMDKQERETFRASLAEEPPPATVENITATVDRLIGDAELIFQRGIANAFAALDRRFRSHDGFKIGSRVVLSHALNEFGSWNHYQRHDDTMLDVERAFCRLDGQSQPERMGGIVGVIDASRVRSGLRLQAFEVENEYFRVRIFGNGNAHLWFKRKDLVERVNLVLAAYYGASLGVGPDAAPQRHAYSTAVARNMGWFATPDAVAKRVLDEARIWTSENHSGEYPRLTVLEPSAGEGALALPAAQAGHRVVCVELHPGRVQTLRAAGLITRDGDFLSMGPAVLAGEYDRILMNPPFDRGLDVDHVTHALRFLKAGGTLVAVMAAGVEFREDAKTRAFRAEVERRGGRFRDLPVGSFAEAGTNVNTCLCIIGGRG